MERKHHENRVLRIARRVAIERENKHAIYSEWAVPRASRFIDAVMAMEQPGSGWGPLIPLIDSRLVLLEHFSEPPSLSACMRLVAKLAHLVDDWWTDRKDGECWVEGSDVTRHGSLPPMLLIMSDGQPRKALARLRFEPGPVAGIWQIRRPEMGDLVLVNMRGLPMGQPGCSVLRLMAESTDVQEARAAIAALLADPAVLQSTKDGLLEEMMAGTIPTTPAERFPIIERIRQEGRQEGVRETLLSIARARCGEEVLRDLAEIEDVEALRRRVLALLGDG
jgi:hypothetical protein